MFLQLTPKQLRQVYAPEIGALSKGPLAVIEKQNKKLYEEKIAEYLLQQFNNLENHYVRVLSYLAVKEKIRCVFVFDNADQHDFELQQEVFRFAHAIAGKCFALSIVTMWEETYLRSKQGGALSAYSTTAYSLHPTSVVDIINRRLEYIVKELQDGGLARDLLDQLAPADDVRDYLTLIRDSIFYHGRRVRFFLESLAMGNLRRALDLFSLFLTSGHTDASKILASHRSARGYLVPLHEFIKSIGLGDFPYYHGDLSAVLNLYSISDESRPSHLTKVRLLEYLSYHRNRSSSFGIGFVRTDIICAEFDRIGTSAFDLAESLRILVQYSVIENDQYNLQGEGRAYRVTHAGRYYVRYLAVRFSYLDLVLQDTPIADLDIFDKIIARIDSKDLHDRFDRVELFLAYLRDQEEREHAAIVGTSESIPLRRRFLADMLPEFENEKAYILRMVGERKNRPTQIATPYKVSEPAE